MSENTSQPQNSIPAWLQFEHDVAKLFELFGYDEVTHNIKIEGGQCDVFAISRKRSKANIVAECKYHQNTSTKVGITDVQAFIYKVTNYRNSGKIDQGYLITNTGFTADARAAINDSVANYVFLLTYDELIQSLLDINHYLQEFVTDYNIKGEGNRYVEMKLINTTPLNKTLLDSLPGDLIKTKGENQRYLVVPRSHIDGKHEQLPFLDYDSLSVSPTVKPILFIQKLQEYHNAQVEARNDHIKELTECLSRCVSEIAAANNDELLHELFKALTADMLKLITWSPEAVVDALLDKWEELGGHTHFKIFNKADLRKRIHREIIKKYKTQYESIYLKSTEVPKLISDFKGHILEGIGIRPGEMKSLLKITKEKERLWTAADEFENIFKHLNLDSKKTHQLNLIFEEDALPALERYIISNNSSTLVLIGDYGAGKTTILRRLMRKLAEDKLSRQNDPNCRIPLYITLRDYNKVPDIQSLIRLFLNNVVEVDNVSIRTFKKLNEDGRFVLLLDAFDEMLTRVTKADRRRCFREIAELVSKKSKIILTGRPAYFNDYKELKDNLENLRQKFTDNEMEVMSDYEVMCLQLLDEDQVEQLIVKASPMDSKNVLNILVNKPNLMDLARRPVLASMISQTGKELIKLENQKISARNIYEIYTNKWVQREEDKGVFRHLVHPEQKSIFLRYLAMQMHISGSLKIHYTELDKSVAQYFKLETVVEVDHFSHDIRTCSFLSRTDDGYYFFIHKSFMEYFVAREFEQGESSPFADKLSNPLTTEIIDLLDLDLLPDRISKLWRNRENLESCLKTLKHYRDKVVKHQRFEEAASVRDIEKFFQGILEQLNSIFTMKPIETDLLYRFKKDLKNIISEFEARKWHGLNEIKTEVETLLSELALKL